jgi:hypothetical protein
MSYFIRHRRGAEEDDPPLEALSRLLDELDEDPADSEHTSVSVTHETEWTVSVYRDGFLILENFANEDLEPMHLAGQTTEGTVSLLTAIAKGAIDEVRAAPWRPGYGN